MDYESSSSRLTSIDEWGNRKHIIPAPVLGPWRRWRSRIYFALMLIFLAAPWTKVGGLQTIWLDIPARRFTILGQVFMAHDAPLIFFILSFAALTLTLVTALWGRLWCGWACPQTVFIDAVYRRLEEWIEGSYRERRRMRTEAMTLNQFFRHAFKWLAFLIVSSILAHSFIAYFSGASALIEMIKAEPGKNWGYFLSVAFLTSLFAFNFGWFREQFCIVMCPYGRMQAVLMDGQSKAIIYDHNRGEPRRSLVRSEQKRGDCISCNRCVDVCPTGIDIRNGVQMECIACTACIDACSDMMKKVNRPPNLIRFGQTSTPTSIWKRPRILVNILALAAVILGLLIAIATRNSFYVSVLRAKDAPYQILPTQDVSNHFRLHIHNQSHHKEVFKILLPSPFQEIGVRLMPVEQSYSLDAGQNREIHVFLTFPKNLIGATGELKIDLEVIEVKSGSKEIIPLQIVGPTEN